MTEKATKTEAASAAETVTSFDLTLDDYCRRLSAGKVGPELIGGFHHSCTVAGVTKGSQESFAQAFTAFTSQPA